ncbi:MAG: hypothetical protein NXY57DRAFT_224462 [Lentinula lateritia]|nr:MAG: hypothetical protein NXY57DRAFT_224462 [Lentinula lateritia]
MIPTDSHAHRCLMFQAVSLCPSWLTDRRSRFGGKLDTAAKNDTKGWFDILEGEIAIGESVNEVARKGRNCIEGEDSRKIHNKAD